MATNDEDLARALLDILEEDDPDAFIGQFETSERIAIDGRFNLMDVARKLRETMAAAMA